jgi:hypothetical protein
MHTPSLLLRPLALAAAFATTLFANPPPPPGPHTLWYRTAGEASVTNGLPVGNGRLGALVAGTVATDQLAVSEQTVWSGGPFDFDNPAALTALPEVRRLLFAGDYARAHSLIGRNFGSYQVLAFLDLAFDAHAAEATADRLELDLVIPPNTSASVHVPAADPRQIKESGKAASRAKGVRLLRHDSGRAVFTVGSGTYRFTAPLPLPEVAP